MTKKPSDPPKSAVGMRFLPYSSSLFDRLKKLHLFKRRFFKRLSKHIMEASFKSIFPLFLMFLILAKKCNPCDHLICYNNLPLDMHEIFNHSFGDSSDVS